MKSTHLFALALAAALSIAPGFAQQSNDKPADTKAQDNAGDKAVKPESGSVKTQEAGQENPNKNKEARDSKLPQSDQEPGVKNPDNEKNDQTGKQGSRAQDNEDRKTDNKDAARMPQSDQEPGAQDRKDEGRDDHGQANDRDRNTHFQIKSDARNQLREHYKNVSHNRNITIEREQVLPVEVRTEIQPVPEDVVTYLGPPPAGFMYGFADGYVFVYDPTTFFVIDVMPVF